MILLAIHLIFQSWNRNDSKNLSSFENMKVCFINSVYQSNNFDFTNECASDFFYNLFIIQSFFHRIIVINDFPILACIVLSYDTG